MSLANHSVRGKSLWLQSPPSAKTEVYLLYPSVALLPKPSIEQSLIKHLHFLLKF